MKFFTRFFLVSCLASCWFFTPVLAQCITDDCGDIFADWALISQEITVCEGATFEVANQTIMPDIDFYVWDWGNGERDTVYEVSNHFYTYIVGEGADCSSDNDFIVYNISLEIYRFCEEGQSCHTQIAPVAIRLKPRADFNIPPVICAGETLAITNESCYGRDYLWVFGDGTTSTDPNPSHVFDSSGVYDVTLYVSNTCGTDSVSTSIQVFDSPLATSVANGEPTITSGCAPLSVTFNNQSENANTYTWDFPSSAGVVFTAPFHQNSPSPTVEFTSPGIHTVTLYASNECGQSQWTTTIEVLESPQITLISLPPSCGAATFSLGDFLESSGTITDISWTVDGPAPIDIPVVANPIVTFSQAGNYEIRVSASNSACEPVSAVTSFYVQEEGTLAVELPSLDPVCDLSDPVSLSASPSGGIWSGVGVTPTGFFDPTLAGLGIHNLQYQIADGACIYEDNVEIEVLPGQDVTTADALAFCENEGIATLEFSPAGGQWSGPGISDPSLGLFDPAINGAGSFDLSYELMGDNGCLTIKQTQVLVNPSPEVTLELPDHSCAGEQIEVSITPEAGITYSWLFNGVETFSGESIQVNIVDGGTYPIQLSAVNAAGCEAITNEDLNVSALPQPSYALDAYEGCGPLTIDITNNGSTAEETYEWNFGNGTTSTAAAPQDITFLPTVFDTTYQIELNVTNLCGSATYTETVNVLARPVAEFGIPVDSGCGSLEISFANTTTGSAATYFWDFGNGETSEDLLPANQLYTTSDTSATTYDITLIATNLCGSDSTQHSIVVEPANITPFFNVSDTQGCEPLTIEFADYSNYGANISWNFGDGTTTTETDPVHTFDQAGYYTVYQYVHTVCGTDSAMVNIDVLPAPSAMFEHDPVICPDENVTFENQSSEFITVFWDFGDGNYSTEVTPEHSYQEPGTYPVTMVITNADFLCQSSYNSTVNILDRPSGGIITEGDSACPPLAICFEAEHEGASFFEWSFGDQNTSTNLNPCHTFTEPGRYTVDFRVADEHGCFSAYDSINIRIFDQPVAAIEVPQDIYCGDTQTISFINNSTNGATNYQWTFSNGVSSNLFAPTMTFNNIGSYTVELLASNSLNCEDRAFANFTIAPQPLADFAPILDDGCVPETVTFDNASVSATDYLWDFGNGETTSEVDPSIVYRDPGNYSVTLVVSYDNLCFDSLELDGSISLLSKPTAAFRWDIPTDTYRGLVQFTNESENANNYLWNFRDGISSEAVHPLYDHGENGDWETELIAMDLNGCTDTAFVKVTPDFIYDLFFPNALSPESGQGDVRVFKPAGIGLEAWTLEIFSPWGQRVFLSEELNEDQPAASWDGRYKEELLPQGAYAYKAKVSFLNGIQRVYTGSVTLLR